MNPASEPDRRFNLLPWREVRDCRRRWIFLGVLCSVSLLIWGVQWQSLPHMETGSVRQALTTHQATLEEIQIAMEAIEDTLAKANPPSEAMNELHKTLKAMGSDTTSALSTIQWLMATRPKALSVDAIDYEQDPSSLMGGQWVIAGHTVDSEHLAQWLQALSAVGVDDPLSSGRVVVDRPVLEALNDWGVYPFRLSLQTTMENP